MKEITPPCSKSPKLKQAKEDTALNDKCVGSFYLQWNWFDNWSGTEKHGVSHGIIKGQERRTQHITGRIWLQKYLYTKKIKEYTEILIVIISLWWWLLSSLGTLVLFVMLNNKHTTFIMRGKSIYMFLFLGTSNLIFNVYTHGPWPKYFSRLWKYYV